MQSPGKNLYFILWGGAALIGMAMAIIGYNQQRGEKKLLKNRGLISNKSSDNAINELLLSGDELTIEEKKSFISLYLKPGDDEGAITYQKINTKREGVYKQILQRKMNRLNGKPSDDFSVRPVPK